MGSAIKQRTQPSCVILCRKNDFVAKISRFQKKSRKWLIFALPFGRKVVFLH